MRSLLKRAVLGAIFSASFAAFAQPLTPEPSPVISQPAVQPTAERFADLANFTLDTPAFAAKKTDFTTDAELQSFLQRRIAPSSHVVWRSLGKTPGGRELHLLVLTQDGRGDPVGVAASRKPNVWVVGQQHGNEPAGAEAALELLRRLVSTDLRLVLDKINVIVVPRANPDGAAHFKRETSKGDMNRDHLLMSLSETQMLHIGLDAYPPSVVIDAHEFTAAGRWMDRYGAAQASDLLVQSASHPGVSEHVKKIAKDWFDPALQAAWSQVGLRSFVYHTLNIQGTQSFVQMGGNFAGIGRNSFGLYGAVSYLIESRGVGIGKDHYPRRVASQVISMVAILKTAAKHADDLRALARDARKTGAAPAPAASHEWIVDHSVKREMRALPLYDPVTGEDKTVMVDFQNSLAVTPTVVRALPLGYLLPPNHPLAGRLRALGLNVHRLTASVELDVDSYIVKSLQQESGEFGAPQDKVSTDMKRSKRTFEAGSFWIPMTAPGASQQQPLWRVASAVLEPEGVGSYASHKLLGELAIGSELALHRVVPLGANQTHALNAPVLD